MEYNREKIGERIRTIRAKKKISQEELADICGINKATLCRLEKGSREPSVRTLFSLAKGLNVPLSDILEPGAEYFEGPTDESLMNEMLMYMRRLNEDEQRFVLETMRKFVRLKAKESS